MEKTYAYIRQNWIACTLGALVLCSFAYLTLSGRECFNCKQTEIYKSGQARGATYLRFRHK